MSRGGHGSRNGNRSGRKGKRNEPFVATSKTGVDFNGATREGCSSQKWAWIERAGAKSLAKALRNAGSKGVREYRCPECDRWHAGHLPQAARTGRLAANDVYRP